MSVLQLPPSYFLKLSEVTCLITSVFVQRSKVKMCLVSSVWSVEKMLLWPPLGSTRPRAMSERCKLYLHSYMSLHCLQLYILI